MSQSLTNISNWTAELKCALDARLREIFSKCATAELRRLPYHSAVDVELMPLINGVPVEACTSLARSRCRIWVDGNGVTQDLVFQFSLERVLACLQNWCTLEDLEYGGDRDVIDELTRADLLELYAQFVEEFDIARLVVHEIQVYGAQPWNGHNAEDTGADRQN